MRRLAGVVVGMVALSGCGAIRPTVTDMTGHAKPAASTAELKQWSTGASTALSVMRGFFDQFGEVLRYNNDPTVFQKTCQAAVQRIPLLQQAAPNPAPDPHLDLAYRQTLDGFVRYVSECAAADDHAATQAYNDYATGSDAVMKRVNELS